MDRARDEVEIGTVAASGIGPDAAPWISHWRA